MKRRDSSIAPLARPVHFLSMLRHSHAARLLSPRCRENSAPQTASPLAKPASNQRLAMGSGTVGVGHHSHQTALASRDSLTLLLNGYDHGLRFFDSADSYGSHPHVAETLKHVPRDKVTILPRPGTRRCLGPCRSRSLSPRTGTDHIDVCLMHCLTEGDWTERFKGLMDCPLRSQGKRRHSRSWLLLPQHRSASRRHKISLGRGSLVRINPIGSYMDSDPTTVVSVMREMRAAGKGIVGMKILGQGDLRHRQTKPSISLSGSISLDAFTIGAESQSEQEDLIRRIAAA